MELLAIARHLKNKIREAHFIINPYEPAEKLLREAGLSYETAEHDELEIASAALLGESEENCIVINHRDVSYETLRILKKRGYKVAVIDQLGGKKISCDLLINSAIVPDWRKYAFSGKEPLALFDAEYAILRPEFSRLHEKSRSFADSDKNVLVTMGGVDRTGATLRITRALARLKSEIKKTVILGGGFPHLNEFFTLSKELNISNFTFKQNPGNLGEIMARADLAISAGGNTLYELACVGTPSLVLWEDNHEDVLGREFASRGAALHLGNGMSVPEETIANVIESLTQQPDKLTAMSIAGKKITDGKGLQKIGRELLRLISE